MPYYIAVEYCSQIMDLRTYGYRVLSTMGPVVPSVVVVLLLPNVCCTE